MGIKPLDSGLWSGEWRLDVGRATLGKCQLETDFVVVVGDICEKIQLLRHDNVSLTILFRAH